MSLSPIWQEKVGDSVLRIFRDGAGWKGAIIREGRKPEVIASQNLAELKKVLRGLVGRHDPAYFGFDGARQRFKSYFCGGFSDLRFIGAGQGAERPYKVRAAERLHATLPINAARTASGAGEAALAVYRATDVLASFEMMRVQDLLRGPDADRFLRLVAEFAAGNDHALSALRPLLRPHGADKWTIVTYLPWLWRPDVHIFLKPNVTCDFARRVGHPFARDYTAELRIETYRSLLDLVAQIRTELSELSPRDNIDLQSFIWVVGAYPEPEKPPREQQEGK